MHPCHQGKRPEPACELRCLGMLDNMVALGSCHFTACCLVLTQATKEFSAAQTVFIDDAFAAMLRVYVASSWVCCCATSSVCWLLPASFGVPTATGAFEAWMSFRDPILPLKQR